MSPLPGMEQPTNPGPKIGQKYVKSALKRLAIQHPHLLETGCLKVLEDAAGVTKVSTVTKDGDVVPTELHPRDRRMAMEYVRNTLDGMPRQELDIEGAPSTSVVILNASPGKDPAWPDDIERMLKEELDQGEAEPHDIDDEQPPEDGEDFA